jgi:hypothetical protein
LKNRLFKLHSIITNLESEKYLEPHYSISLQKLVDYLFNNSAIYKIPEGFILRQKEKMRDFKKFYFSNHPNSQLKSMIGKIKITKDNKMRKVFSEERDSFDQSQPMNLSDNDMSTFRPKTRPGTKSNLQLNLSSQNWMLDSSKLTKPKPQTRKSNRKNMFNQSMYSSTKSPLF